MRRDHGRDVAGRRTPDAGLAAVATGCPAGRGKRRRVWRGVKGLTDHGSCRRLGAAARLLGERSGPGQGVAAGPGSTRVPQAVRRVTVGWACRPAAGELVALDGPFAQWQSADEPAGQSDRHVPRRHSPLTGMHDTGANCVGNQRVSGCFRSRPDDRPCGRQPEGSARRSRLSAAGAEACWP
jgi:hypothetical protein